MKIERKKLLAVLEPLKPALPVKTAIEAQQLIWFDKQYAYAHDSVLGVRVMLETPFDFGVPGRLLLGLLEQASAEEVVLEPKDGNLSFKVGRSNVKLITMDKARRPQFYPSDGKPKASMSFSKELAAGLRRVLVLKPAKVKRLEHSGVCIFAAGKELELYTTDSRSLALMPVAQKSPLDRLLLPRIFVEQLLTQCGENTPIEIHDNYFCARAEQVTVYSSVQDTTAMLDLPKHADRLSDAKFFLIPEGFVEELQRAVLLAGPDEPIVSLQITGKKLMLRGELKLGVLAGEFDLGKSLPECSVLVNVEPLLVVPSVDEMMISSGAVALRGKDDFMFFVALCK